VFLSKIYTKRVSFILLFERRVDMNATIQLVLFSGLLSGGMAGAGAVSINENWGLLVGATVLGAFTLWLIRKEQYLIGLIIAYLIVALTTFGLVFSLSARLLAALN
jgi:hypothetical protein